MKRILVLVALVLVTASALWAVNRPVTFTNCSNPRMLRDMLNDWFEGFNDGWFLFSPSSSAPTAAEGKLYYDDTADVLKLRNGAGWINVNGLDNVEVFDANDTLAATETGKVCVWDGHTGVAAADGILTLPSAVAGLTFTFYDANIVAADDLWITAAAGDTINGGTAAKSYKCTGDAVKQHVTIVAADATRWLIVAEDGTWANDNN